MTKDEQLQFTKELLIDLKEDLLDNAKKFPEHWTGIDIRIYVSNFFALQHTFGFSPLELKKRRNQVMNDSMNANI